MADRLAYMLFACFWFGLTAGANEGDTELPRGAVEIQPARAEAKADPAKPDPPEDPRASALAESRRQQNEVLKHAGKLQSTDLEIVRTAVTGLVEIGSPLAIPYLWQLYGVGDADRRSLALRAFRSMRPKEQAERYEQVSLEDPLWALRREAAELLAREWGQDVATARYIQELEKLNSAGDPGTESGRNWITRRRWRLIQQIAHLGGKGASETLSKLLDDKTPDVAVGAAEALAILGRPQNVKPLLPHLKNEDLELRPAIADAVEQLTGEAYRYDYLKWEQWLEQYDAGLIKPRQALDSPGAETQVYSPDYRDPYAAPVTKACVDFVVIFDTTPSLKNIWPEVSNALRAVIRQIEVDTPSLRLGAIRYRAARMQDSLNYLVKPLGLSRDYAALKAFIVDDVSFGGGSGGLHLGIKHAVEAFTWRANARKVVLIIGDVTPKDQGYYMSCRLIKDAATYDRIHFNALYIRSMHGEEHKQTYRSFARFGNGRFYEYNKAERRLLDLSLSKLDPKAYEAPARTLEKWLTPLKWDE